MKLNESLLKFTKINLCRSLYTLFVHRDMT